MVHLLEVRRDEHGDGGVTRVREKSEIRKPKLETITETQKLEGPKRPV
jgi:hypothetical protein